MLFKKQDTPVLTLALLLTLAAMPANLQKIPRLNSPAIASSFTPPKSLKPGTTIRLDSSNALPLKPETSPATRQAPDFPWSLWLLPLIALPLLAWWLLGRRAKEPATDALLTDRSLSLTQQESPMILTATDCQNAYALASGSHSEELVSNDFVMTSVNAGHPPVHYNGQRPIQTGPVQVGRENRASNGCRLVMMPKVPQRVLVGAPMGDEPQAYVYWDLPESARQPLLDRGGRHLVLRVYDATNIDLDHQAAHSFRQYPVADDARDRVVLVPQGNRDYVAEMGYLTDDGRMLPLVRSTHAHVPLLNE